MGRKNIAVVDDDDGARFIISKYLESEPDYDIKLYAELSDKKIKVKVNKLK